MSNLAYIIVGLSIHDADLFRQYAEGALPVLSELSATVMAAANDVELLRGNWTPERLVVLKFPSMSEARAFWDAPEYAPFKALRESCSDSDIMLVDGADEFSETAAAADSALHFLLGCSDMLNTDWGAEYQEKTTPIARKYGLVARCRSDKFEVLDGTFNRRSMILLQFPSEESFRAFWNDPDYAPLKRLREDNTEGEQVAFAAGFVAV